MNLYLILKKEKKQEKYLLLFLLFFTVFYLPPFTGLPSTQIFGQQQKPYVSGTVIDTKGEPLLGVSVEVAGKKTGTITDTEGKFQLNVSPGTKLLVSYIGYKTETVIGKNNMKIVLEEDINQLQEVEVVAYGVQKKVSVTGALSSVKGEDIVKTSVGSISNMISGQLAGLSTIQYSGEPGSDAATIFVRGRSTFGNNSPNPLIQVDGVERDFNDIDPNEIESITVLKDASATAVFGVRGANGVVLITTKRGKEGSAKISFTGSETMLSPTAPIKLANSYQYATFYNQMSANDGGAQIFSDAVIQKFKDHSDPIRFPDTDWIKYCMKDASMQSQYNLNISGGTSSVRYFISAGAFSQGGLFKQYNLPYDLSYQYNRYNYRANLDIDVTKTTTLALNLGGMTNNTHKPYTSQGSSGMMKAIYAATPFSSPGLVDGKLVYATTDYSDVQLPFTGGGGMTYYGNGFMETSQNTLNADLSLNQKLDFLTKGFSFTLKGSYNSDFYVYNNGSASIATYTPVLQSDGTIAYKKSGTNSEISYSQSSNKARNWYMETSLNYDRKFGSHHVGGLLLYNQSKTYYPSVYPDVPHGYVGLVGRATYDYKGRYLVEFDVGHNGSENFASERRFGWFPASSVGWILSEENFWKEIKPYIGFLKLRASYGKVGNDQIGTSRFMYTPDPYYVDNSTSVNRGGWAYNFGINNASLTNGAYAAGTNNPYVTWERAYKQNYGADVNFLDNRLTTTFDYFIEHRKDILLQDQTAPGILGFTTPFANLGMVKSWGYEVSAKWSDKVGKDFRYWIGCNLSYNQNRIIEEKEAPEDYPYQYQKGHRIGSNQLYKFFGFYNENTPTLYKKIYGEDFPTQIVTNIKDGDCVYVDLNHDGKIDSQDMSYDYGYSSDPEFIIGSNMGFSWKKFDVTAQWAGAWNVSRLLSGDFRQPFYSSASTTTGGLLLMLYGNTWTVENPDAMYPRATWADASDNYVNSTLWLKNSSYLRLKNIQIAYHFSFPFMKKIKLSSCLLALSGYNLLTITGYKWGDPESRASTSPDYPVTKTYTLTLQLGF